jgi:molecular chaperone GrpE (heat shock protein)
VILTQAEYDAIDEKDPNALYVISDANETEDNNFVTEAQLESRGFLTQTDKSELNEYDSFLLDKITELETKLTEALNKIAALEAEMENTLTVA